jgi:hypothetical protein
VRLFFRFLSFGKAKERNSPLGEISAKRSRRKENKDNDHNPPAGQKTAQPDTY